MIISRLINKTNIWKQYVVLLIAFLFFITSCQPKTSKVENREPNLEFRIGAVKLVYLDNHNAGEFMQNAEASVEILVKNTGNAGNGRLRVSSEIGLSQSPIPQPDISEIQAESTASVRIILPTTLIGQNQSTIEFFDIEKNEVVFRFSLQWIITGSPEPVLTVSDANGSIISSGASLNCGETIVGQEKAYRITLTNTGSVELSINNFFTDSLQTDFQSNSLDIPIVLTPQQKYILEILFKPAIVGPINTTLYIRANIQGELYTCTLTGTGLEPPPTHYFDESVYYMDGFFPHESSYEMRDTIGRWPSVFLDANGTLNVLYTNGSYENKIVKKKWTGKYLNLWDEEIIESIGYTGLFTTMAIAPDGKQWIIFYGKGILYCKYQGADGWQTEKIAEGGAFYNPSIAIGNDGVVHCVYNDAMLFKLVYARRENGTWNKIIIDDQPYIIKDEIRPVICIDKNNQIHVAAGNTKFVINDYFKVQLKIYQLVNGNWQSTIIPGDMSNGIALSMSLDSNNKPHIAYSEHQSYMYMLKYAYQKPDNTWQTETVDPKLTYFTGASIGLSNTDVPHIAYFNGAVNYAMKENGFWKIRELDSAINPAYENASSVGYFIDMMFDPQGRSIIAYLVDGDIGDFGRTGLTLLIHDPASPNPTGPLSIGGSCTNFFSGFSINEVEVTARHTNTAPYKEYQTKSAMNGLFEYKSMPEGNYTFILKHPDFASFKSENMKFKVQDKSDSMRIYLFHAEQSIIDERNQSDGYAETSIALDSQNKVSFLYRDYSNDFLRCYQQQTDMTWNLKIVDDSQRYLNGLNSSSMFSNDNILTTSYFRGQSVYFGSRINDVWEKELVFTLPDADSSDVFPVIPTIYDLQLCYTSDNIPLLAFTSGDSVYFSSKKNGVWQTELVTTLANVFSVSMTIQNKQPVLAFSSYKNLSIGVVQVARLNQNIWEIATVDSSIEHEFSPQIEDCAILRTNNDELHLLYLVGGMLYHAIENEGIWSKEKITTYSGTTYKAEKISAAVNPIDNRTIIVMTSAYSIYAHGGLVLTTIDGNKIKSALLDPSVIHYPSMAIESNGKIHIGYVDTDKRDLIYWKIQQD